MMQKKLFSMLAVGIKMAGMLILTPIVLRQLSVEESAIWMIFLSITGLVSILDFGFSPTFIRMVAYGEVNLNKKIANYKSYSKEEIVKIIHSIYKVLGLTSLILGAGVGYIILEKTVNKLNNVPLGWTCWGIAIIGISYSISNSRYSVIMQGMNRITELRKIEIFTYSIGMLLTIFSAYYYKTLEAITITYYGGIILSGLTLKLIFLKIDSRLENNSSVTNIKLMKIVWGSAWRSGVGGVATYATIQLGGLILSSYEEPNIIVSYLFASRIIQAYGMLVKPILYSELPLLARYYAQNRKDEIIKISDNLILLMNLILVIGLVSIGLIGQNLFDIIKIKAKFPNEILWIAMISVEIVASLGASYLQIQSLSNNIYWHIINGITSVVTIVIMIVAVPKIGVMGFPISAVMSNLFIYLPISYLIYQNEYFSKFTMPDKKIRLLYFIFVLYVIIEWSCK